MSFSLTWVEGVGLVVLFLFAVLMIWKLGYRICMRHYLGLSLALAGLVIVLTKQKLLGLNVEGEERESVGFMVSLAGVLLLSAYKKEPPAKT
jgi:drug/metabolite transporter (DMT)-like permease